MINIIVAATINNVIGKDNDLPWNLPTDMKHFKTITNGHSVLMGRKCWESIPEKFRPLPNRNNIILTRDTDYVAKGATVINDLTDVIKKYKNSSESLFIIGGAEIYKLGFPHTDNLYLTLIHSDIEGDVILEGLNINEWELKDYDEPIVENGFTYNIAFYVRKK